MASSVTGTCDRPAARSPFSRLDRAASASSNAAKSGATPRCWFQIPWTSTAPATTPPLRRNTPALRRTCKILACEAFGRPLALVVTGGNTNDCTQFTTVME
ncbi:hypothetical protein ACFVZZ_37470, partial [Streptomyces chartreusis]